MAGTVVICFTDIVASTELLTRLGDDTFDDLRRRHFEVLERQVDAHGGEVVKSLGDGLMLAFGSASDAVSAGVAMQRAVDAASRGAANRIEMRVGISAGDATKEGDDWFGVPVVEGSRLCATAAPGQIVVSEVVRLLSGSRGGHEFRSVGTLELKGIPEPVGAAEVVWTPAAATLAVPLPGPLAADEGELPFSGRDTALEQLQTEWKAAAAGDRRIVMIAGEPGVGKTRLVSELARAVHADGALVLLGRTDEHVDAPYGPWREALRGLVRSAPDEVLERHVSEHGGELARIVPELERRVPGTTISAAPDPETERLLLFEAVTGLVSATSTESPVLLVLDDLHWADRSSLLLLLHLLKADAPAALLVLATYRDTDLDRAHPLAATLADLRRLRGASRVALTGLDSDGITALLTIAGGNELDDQAREFAAMLLRETEGNPFFVGEVLLHLVESGGLVQEGGRWRASATLAETGLPEGVREVIGRRLAGLPDETNAVLGVASVIGREFDVTFVADVAEEPVGAILDALEPAERARLITEVPGRPARFSFAHALVRTVLVEELGTNRRVRLHRAAGVALEALADPPLGELAYHFGEAAVMGETERAVRYAREAAQQALDLAAPEEAVSLLRNALETARLGGVADSDRAGLLLLLGRALDVSAARAEACDVVADAFALAVAAGDVDTACAAAIEFGGLNILWVDDPRVLAQIHAALDLLPAGDSARRAELLTRRAQVLMNAPGAEGRIAAREAYDMAVRVNARSVQRRAAAAVANVERNIDPAGYLRFSEELLATADAGFDAPSLYTYMYVAEARLVFGDLDGADAAVAELIAAFDASGLRALEGYREWHRQFVDAWRIVRALIAGDFDDVKSLIAGFDAFPPEQLMMSFSASNGRTQLAYLRGDWEGATAGWAEIRALAGSITDAYFGYIGAAGGLEDVRRYWEQWIEIEGSRPAWTRPANTGVIAETLRRLGEREASAAIAAEFAGHSGYFLTNTTSWFYGPFDTGLGILWMNAGDLDAAVTHLTRAVAQCDAIVSPSWGAVARLELATAARLRNAPGDEELASAIGAEARRAMTEVGMPGWLARLDLLEEGDLEPWRCISP